MTKDPPLEETLDGFLHHRTPGSIRWKADLGILDIAEVKTVPYVPLSHPSSSV